MLQPKEYIKKPLTFEAVQLTEENYHEVSKWCNGYAASFSINTKKLFVQIRVKTPDGDQMANAGSYIVKDALGNFFVYSEDDFDVRFKENKP